MSDKKYELTDEITVYNNTTLYRIRALRSFSDVQPGDLGGWIEGEKNLSHDGDCWVYDESIVMENGIVRGNGQVHNFSKVIGSGIVMDNGITTNNAIIRDNGIVMDSGFVGADVIIDGFQIVRNYEVWKSGDNK